MKLRLGLRTGRTEGCGREQGFCRGKREKEEEEEEGYGGGGEGVGGGDINREGRRLGVKEIMRSMAKREKINRGGGGVSRREKGKPTLRNNLPHLFLQDDFLGSSDFLSKTSGLFVPLYRLQCLFFS